MTDYDKETVTKLRAVLKERGIPSTGLTRKQQIIEKLEEYDAENQASNQATKTNKRPRVDEPTPDNSKRARTTEPESQPDQKPRLTTPDLEFEYDRSQLRDPRPTPCRERRPHYDDHDCPADLKEELANKFSIPKAEKPKGRLNSFQKNKIFRQEGLMNPLHAFHPLYVCHRKGRDGSPTYDEAGFQLDWDKVDRWMKPQTYNKKRIMRNMDKAVEKSKSEEAQMFDIFFLPDKGPTKDESLSVKDYIKDHVSKDLGVPWHTVGPKYLKTWEHRGFQKVDFKDWWRKPNDEENKRILKMMGGASLRKD